MLLLGIQLDGTVCMHYISGVCFRVLNSEHTGDTESLNDTESCVIFTFIFFLLFILFVANSYT